MITTMCLILWMAASADDLDASTTTSVATNAVQTTAARPDHTARGVMPGRRKFWPATLCHHLARRPSELEALSCATGAGAPPPASSATTHRTNATSCFGFERLHSRCQVGDHHCEFRRQLADDRENDRCDRCDLVFGGLWVAVQCAVKSRLYVIDVHARSPCPQSCSSSSSFVAKVRRSQGSLARSLRRASQE